MDIYIILSYAILKKDLLLESSTTYISIFKTKNKTSVLKLNKVLEEVSEGQLNACNFEIFYFFLISYQSAPTSPCIQFCLMRLLQCIYFGVIEFRKTFI